jgi:tetratricopeptide (TPR) repeat protein
MKQAVFRQVRAFEPGEVVLNRFHVRRFLGAGGMGEVYEAFDSSLGEVVALKTVRNDLAYDADVVQSFRWEVQRARRVTHSNVCRVYDLFTCMRDGGDERSFLTMELLPGGTLYERVNESPIDSQERLALALQIADGLAAAHQAGLVHGDLKSGNILLVRGDRLYPRAVITDFGLARLASAPELRRERTKRRAIAGTPAYLAPELFNGRVATQKSDIYALGIVMFRMTLRRYPFASTDDPGKAHAERLDPPLHLLREPDIDPLWADTVCACMNPDPAGRPASAAEISRRLAPATITLVGMNPAPVSRRKTLVVAGLTVLAAAGGVWEYIEHARVPQPVVVRIGQFSTAAGDAPIGRAVANLFRLTLATSTLARVVPREQGKSQNAAAGKPNTEATSAERLTPEATVTGQITAESGGYRIRAFITRISTGKRTRTAEETAKGIRDLAQAVRRASIGLGLAPVQFAGVGGVGNVPLDEIDTSDPDALADMTDAVDEYSHGNLEVAHALLERACTRDENFALAYVYRAVVYYLMRRDDLAFVPAARAMELKSRLSARVRPHAEAVYFYLCGDYTNALAKYYDVAHLYPTEVPLQRHLSQMYTIVSRPAEALAHAKTAVELDGQNPQNLMMLASAYADLNQFGDAWRTLEGAEKLAPNAPYMAFAKGYVSLLEDKIDRAFEYYGSVVKPDLEGFAQSFQMRALLLGGRLNDAENRLHLGLNVRTLEKDSANEDLYRYWLGELYILQGDPARALEQATALASRDAMPPSLFALRGAAEIAHAAGNGQICREVLRKIQQIQSKYPSRRSAGILCQCEGLLASVEGRAAHARELLEQAEEYWKDIWMRWSAGAIARQQHDWKFAQVQYDAIGADKPAAVRFGGANLWVLAGAMSGVCRHADGRYADAVPYYDRFLSRWGQQTTLPIVREIVQARSGTLPVQGDDL